MYITDQPLPKGVHVRINLATGEREAKLLDNTEGSENNKDLSIAPQDNTEEIKYDHKDDVLKYDYIKEALKNIKSDLGSDTPRVCLIHIVLKINGAVLNF